jgi:hypothetical protein
VTRTAAGAMEQNGCVSVPEPESEQFGSFFATYSVLALAAAAEPTLSVAISAAKTAKVASHVRGRRVIVRSARTRGRAMLEKAALRRRVHDSNNRDQHPL